MIKRDTLFRFTYQVSLDLNQMEVTDTYIKVDGEFTLTWESVAGFVVYRSHTFIVDKYTKIYEMGKDCSDEFMKYFQSKDILPGP